MITYFDWNYVHIYCAEIKQFIGAFFTSSLTEFVCEEVRSNRSASTKKAKNQCPIANRMHFICADVLRRVKLQDKMIQMFFKKELGKF